MHFAVVLSGPILAGLILAGVLLAGSAFWVTRAWRREFARRQAAEGHLEHADVNRRRLSKELNSVKESLRIMQEQAGVVPAAEQTVTINPEGEPSPA